MKAAVPVDPAYLLNQSYAMSGKTAQSRSFSITVPSGVTVMEVYYYVNTTSTINLAEPFISSVSGGKTYISHSIKTGSASNTVYVGVTSGKTYTISHSAGIFNKFWDQSINYQIQIKYSQSINAKTPSITDY